MTSNKIDILCLQETEVLHSVNVDSLSIKNFEFELEKNTIKARTGIYLSNCINYKRKQDLEGIDSNLVIIDILTKKGPQRLINVYRSFSPQNNHGLHSVKSECQT